jgi:hypothetical protein
MFLYKFQKIVLRHLKIFEKIDDICSRNISFEVVHYELFNINKKLEKYFFLNSYSHQNVFLCDV